MRPAILRTVACAVLQYFTHYLIKGKIFDVSLFSLQHWSETFLILRSTHKTLSQMCTCLHVTYPLLLSDFNKNWIFSTNFQKVLNPPKSILWEQSCSMWTDRQTDTKNQTVAYRNISIPPTNGSHYGSPQKQHISIGHNYTATGWGACIQLCATTFSSLSTAHATSLLLLLTQSHAGRRQTWWFV
jgi:hypothetical protein